MCNSLYRSKDSSLRNATFYEHLLKLDRFDGLRLATAQMIISSSVANDYLAGGDILRMAANIVQFRSLQTSPSIPPQQREGLHLLTISMDDYITQQSQVLEKFIDFVFLANYTVVNKSMRRNAVMKTVQPDRSSQNSTHVTQGKHEDREELRRALRGDAVLWPILGEVEKLVNEALRQSNDDVDHKPHR